jgi:hypothetical protein
MTAFLSDMENYEEPSSSSPKPDLSVANPQDFILEGNFFILRSEENGMQFIYRTQRAKDANTQEPKDLWWLYIFNGKDSHNPKEFTYAGTFYRNISDKTLMYKTTEKSKFSISAVPVQAFCYVLTRWNAQLSLEGRVKVLKLA